MEVTRPKISNSDTNPLSFRTSGMDDVKTQLPTLELEIFNYFLGRTRAWGVFEDRFGNLRRSFTVDIQGTVVGDELRLDEEFSYDDGEQQQRRWRIRRNGRDGYLGWADDVVGEAKGEKLGGQLRWLYRMLLTINQRQLIVSFDDLMVLHKDGKLLNRANVSKYGIHLGTVFICFSKEFSPSG
ncbi:MAG: DUF3833 domain-containing protein [Motiliproteus sp.]|nr:DUF3833 domain-containing protein [Motiliproteus sp.]MCW9053785.1 DUF3833 domain-containing protein [Motiliproteus sp.]